jgi:putative ABC transport system permease protein
MRIFRSACPPMPNRPFDYFFLDDYFAGLYRSETTFGQLFSLFALLAIILSCVGMLGFTAYELSLRRREVGIRKILGASVPSILWLLFSDLLRPILLAFLIGVPLAAMLMRSWLDHYAYRIHPGASIFLSTAGVLLMIVLATIAYHTSRSALVSPLRASSGKL